MVDGCICQAAKNETGTIDSGIAYAPSDNSPVDPNALTALAYALKYMRESQPALVEWIEGGYPTLTEREYVERFGEYPQYKRSAKHSPDAPEFRPSASRVKHALDDALFHD